MNNLKFEENTTLMMKLFRIIAVLITTVGMAAFGQTNKPPTPTVAEAATAPPATAPVIPDALKLRYFKFELEYEQAQQTTQLRLNTLTEVFKEMAIVCGDKYQPQMAQEVDPDPVCMAKPQATPTPTTSTPPAPATPTPPATATPATATTKK